MTSRTAPLFALALFVCSPLAAAQPTRARVAPAERQAPVASYGYEFGDDLLALAARDGTLPRIVVRPHAARAGLIRPRTSFVTELLASAETL